MEKIKYFLKNFLLLSVPSLIVVFLFLEFVIFRYVLPASQLPQLTFEEEYRLLKPSAVADRDGIHSMGAWTKHAAHWHINNFGWVSKYDYRQHKDRPRIAVIGDSYVMSLEVNTEQTFHHLLNEKLQDSIELYSFGMAGAPLSNYLHVARYVVSNFDPDILIFNLVFNDFDASLFELSAPTMRRRFWTYDMVQDSLLQAHAPDPSSLDEGRLNRFLKSCATGRYLYHNLQITKLRKYFHQPASAPTPSASSSSTPKRSDEQRMQMVKKAIVHTFESLRTEFPDKRIIITLDALRKAIYDQEALTASPLNAYRLALQQATDSLQLEMIDLSPPFQADYHSNGKRFEFIRDPHWNTYAHELVAQTIYDYLSTH